MTVPAEKLPPLASLTGDRPRRGYEAPSYQVDALFETLALACNKKNGSKKNMS